MAKARYHAHRSGHLQEQGCFLKKGPWKIHGPDSGRKTRSAGGEADRHLMICVTSQNIRIPYEVILNTTDEDKMNNQDEVPHYRNIVILTGAGISAESGLATFRDSGGLWAQYRVEDVATPEAFAHNPSLVLDFYNMRRAELQRTAPNKAHYALAQLEAEHDGTVTVITQNVDNFHERAGSKNLLHMHGELTKARCLSCGSLLLWEDPITLADRCSVCGEQGCLRPHIVWFGEIPLYLDDIDTALRHADLFISIGTSGSVYPAAGLVATARNQGAYTVEINMEPSDGRHFFHEGHYGPAGEMVPAFVRSLLGGNRV